MSQATSLPRISENIQTHLNDRLAPQVLHIDTEGHYPGSYLQELGQLGGFSATSDQRTKSDVRNGLARQIAIISAVAQTCGSTAFLVWCQAVCVWYLQNSSNPAVREHYLEPVASGRLLAGTGMSNTVKHLAGIEKIHLRAKRQGNGYCVSGALPWVSNIGTDHAAIVAAAVDGGGYLMFIVAGNAPGLKLHRSLDFAGMNGTRTLGMHFKHVTIPDDAVLAHPAQFSSYIRQIKPGFILTQAGMGLGITASCLQTIHDANTKTAHVNRYLDDQEPELQNQLEQLQNQAAQLADEVEHNRPNVLAVLKLRLAVSELALKAAHSAALHAGARGYLLNHPAQRLQREALFVAIVTPALKHLRKEIHDLEAAGRQNLAKSNGSNQPSRPGHPALSSAS